MVGADQTSAWGFTFYSLAELTTALEEYDTFTGDQSVPGDGGDLVDEDRKDRAWRIMAQNRTIDAGMKLLAWDDRPAWRVIRYYYLQGLWSERWGWLAAARAAGLDAPVCLRGIYSCAIPGDHRGGEHRPKTCPRGDGCLQLYERFSHEVLLKAIERLAVHIGHAQGVHIRSER